MRCQWYGVKRWFALFAFLVVIPVIPASSENILPNGDFEIESQKTPGTPDNWNYGKRWTKGDHYWIEEGARSGKKAMKIEATSYTPPEKASGTGGITVHSNMFLSPEPQSMIEVSAWVKYQDVVSPGSYFKLRFVIYFFDEEGKRIRHTDLLCEEGSRDWTKIENRLMVPKGTKKISVMFGLTACTGIGWIDDVQVRVHKEPLTEQRVLREMEALEGPVIVPEPWQRKEGKERVALSCLIIQENDSSIRLKNAMEPFLKKREIPFFFSTSAVPHDSDTLLILGDKSLSDVSNRMRKVFPRVQWNDLGDQGYFLSVEKKGRGTFIYLGSNRDQGCFYGFQSLLQLIEKEKSGLFLSVTDIADRPALGFRGMAMGLQWFGKKEKAIERLASLRCNFIYNTGSFMGGKFGGNHSIGIWRQPFTKNELTLLQNYFDIAKNYFIDIGIAFSPRLGSPNIRYSSQEDISIIVEKMSQLYALGYRHFGLSFDDLQNVGMERLSEPEDRERFGGDIAKAHHFFISEVYRRLREKHQDITFYMLPLWYGNFARLSAVKKEYLKIVGSLPKEIRFISCPTTIEDIEEARQLTQRYHVVWDNFFAGFERGGSPAFVPPLDRSREINAKNCPGYIFLPMVPANEDSAGTSWLTAADYMWAPERYVATQSFKKAAAKVVGGTQGVAVLEEYRNYAISGIKKRSLAHGEELQTLELKSFSALKGSKEERLTSLRKSIEELDGWKGRLRAVMPEELFSFLEKEIDLNLVDTKLLIKETEEKPFPAKIAKVTSSLDWDKAEPLRDFYLMAGGGKKAEQQTTAYMLYDSEYLYIKVVLREPTPSAMKAIETERDRNVFTDDSVEIFLEPLSGNNRYYHLAVNSLGTVYDAIGKDAEWNGHYRIVTKVEDTFWTVEIAIPFATLHNVSVTSGDKWNFNICRTRTGKEHSSYAMLLKPGFHSPEYFWTMEFE